MARREVYVDDLDGKEHDDVEARRFSVGRQAYSIDLSGKNFEKLLSALEPFIAVATKEEAPSRSLRSPAPRGKANAKGYTAQDVREWAKAEGIAVSDRGRIHREVVEKFEYAKGYDKK